MLDYLGNDTVKVRAWVLLSNPVGSRIQLFISGRECDEILEMDACRSNVIGCRVELEEHEITTMHHANRKAAIGPPGDISTSVVARVTKPSRFTAEPPITTM